MSPQVPCKSKGQHRFSYLVFTGCSSGSSSGMGWGYTNKREKGKYHPLVDVRLCCKVLGT